QLAAAHAGPRTPAAFERLRLLAGAAPLPRRLQRLLATAPARRSHRELAQPPLLAPLRAAREERLTARQREQLEVDLPARDVDALEPHPDAIADAEAQAVGEDELVPLLVELPALAQLLGLHQPLDV